MLGVTPFVSGDLKLGFTSEPDCSSNSKSFDEEPVSPESCSSRTLVPLLMSSCWIHVVSGRRRERSSMSANVPY